MNRMTRTSIKPTAAPIMMQINAICMTMIGRRKCGLRRVRLERSGHGRAGIPGNDAMVTDIPYRLVPCSSALSALMSYLRYIIHLLRYHYQRNNK
jgi:hypothetical protein